MERNKSLPTVEYINTLLKSFNKFLNAKKVNITQLLVMSWDESRRHNAEQKTNSQIWSNK
jgi:hypothetical protein